MTTQTFKQGENTIRVEIAESIEDAKKNGFREGEYNRFFVNDKPVTNYVAMMRFIIDDIKKSGQSIIPDSKKLFELRKQMISNQNKEMKEKLNEIRNTYKNHVNEAVLKKLDDIIFKIDDCGVRVAE
jgi:hypothetical protein